MRQDMGFNSRTLGRVRHFSNMFSGASSLFQFTHPGKGATLALPSEQPVQRVSIHAPWEGCDLSAIDSEFAGRSVSIHAPWEGCDSVVQSCVL